MHAQQVTVQQPVVQRFEINTVASVPDRGGIVLGGLGRSAQGRVTTGPFRAGSGVGSAVGGSQASVHVFIHDFESLEHELLATGGDETEFRAAAESSPSDHAWRVLAQPRSRTGLESQAGRTLRRPRQAANPRSWDVAAPLEIDADPPGDVAQRFRRSGGVGSSGLRRRGASQDDLAASLAPSRRSVE